MTIDVLATGSTGNAVVINGEILIDCGVSYKKLEKSGYIPKLKLVLLTHEHGDHFNPRTAGRLRDARPGLRWGMCEWMVKPALDAGVSKWVIDVIDTTPPGSSSRAAIYNNLALVSPEPLVHDVPNCGWRIGAKHEWLFYATDTGTLDGVEAPQYDYYLIEANHTQAEIEARIKDKLERGEFSYEVRAARTHLSQEQALDWLVWNMGPNSKYIFLHQHQKKEEHDNGTFLYG